MLTLSLRQERKKTQSLHALKEAFVQLILESKEAAAITVSEIADRADFNRSTFYFHYKDKNEIMEDLFYDALNGFREALVAPFRHEKQIRLNDDILPSTRLLFDHIEKNRNLFMALHDIGTTPTLYERLEKLYRTLFSDDFFVLDNRSYPDIDYSILLSAQIHSLLGIIKYWIDSRLKYSSEYMCDQMMMINLNRPADMAIRKRGDGPLRPLSLSQSHYSV
ncbi:TetR/AcrR family transcriptional regulator [Cohnella herbarum]|uniref:TetR family transcriptional regulator n=1 Tax=Cohnella herbarum TaxID=2728023 RepID=A0A7Z2ZN40_9BACL|nr:TetR/AcrR family transcriptional regulator [Cohnella herbarum]QJD85460.1 TetR family transcriptional regulator [Cohnella herbarum]